MPILENLPADADKKPQAATYTLPRYLLDWLTEESERVGKKKSQLVKEALIIMREGSDAPVESEGVAA